MTARTRAQKGNIDADSTQLGDDLEAIAESVGRYARKAFDETHISESAGTLADTIRDEPVKAALTALGIGIVLGMIIKR